MPEGSEDGIIKGMYKLIASDKPDPSNLITGLSDAISLYIPLIIPSSEPSGI